MTIAAIGNVSLDRVGGAMPRVGGTVFYSAHALARLGAEARVAASCAEDDLTTIEPAFESVELPLKWYPSTTTTAFRFRYSASGRRIMRLDSVGKSWSADEALAAAADSEWIHVGALVNTDFPHNTLAALAGGKRKLLVDGQGLVRMPILGPLRTHGNIPDVLKFVSILKLDEREAEVLAGSLDPDAISALPVAEAIVTLGSRGSFVVTNEGLIGAAEAPHVSGSPDPTGAGDTYSAAYLVARSAGAEPQEAAQSATEVVARFLARD